MASKLSAVVEWLYDHLGDPRTKNVFILVLLALSAFGMIAPSTATSLRDGVLSMVFSN